MSFLVTRGLGQEGTAVTGGLGPSGNVFQQALSGILTMAGALATLFIPFSGISDAQKNQGGTSITTDIGID
jgi:hypothetical protein